MTHTKNTITYPATCTSKKLTPTNLILGILAHFWQFRHLRHFICLLLLLIPFPLQAATNVSGHIGADTTWTKAGSPYIVSSDVSVYGDATTGVTLTIEAGVEVRFDEHQSLTIGDGDNKGALQAVGTEEAPIVFTANAETPTPGYWGRIYFDNSTIDEATIMDHCVVAYAGNASAGLQLNSASPTIKNCQIKQNSSYGIYCNNASPIIENSTISNNNNSGIYCTKASSPPITNCTITGNEAGSHGGGMYLNSSSPTIMACSISGNASSQQGGGMYCNASSPAIMECEITGNTSSQQGGGLSCMTSSSPTITRSTIGGNSANNHGGAIYCYDHCKPTLTNCLVVDNTSSQEGGGMYCNNDCSITFTNCTIAGNKAKSYGGIRCPDTSWTIKNSIFWNDTPPEISGASGTVTYSNIRSGYSGEGNISTYSSFIDPDAGDYHLRCDSPCIDTGTGSGAPGDDRDGVTRPLDGNGDDEAHCDMGAYEFLPYPTVTSHSPSRSIQAPVDYIDIFFHKPIDPSSFDMGDVSITGPSGNTIIPDSVTSLTETDGMGFRIEFPPQDIEGIYHVTIGPDIFDLDGNPMDQDHDINTGESPDDQYIATFAIDNSGPRIIKTSISGIQNIPVESINLTFSDAIDPDSFTGEAVAVTGPEGGIEVIGITQILPDIFRINLSSPEIEGTYAVDIKPVMTDIAGNALDQDKDRIQGEIPDDIYSFEFIQEFPDLEVTDISYPLEARAASKIEVVWTVTNTGADKPLRLWTDTIYLSDDNQAGNDTKLGELQHTQPLESGGDYTSSLVVTLPDGITGNRWIIVTTNSTASLYEKTGTDNNTLVATPPLWMTGRPHADLQVTDVTVAGTLGAGETARINWTVRNAGLWDTSATYWHDAIYLSLDTTFSADDIHLANIRNLEFLAPGESYVQTKDITIPKSVSENPYYVIVRTDADNKEVEFASENNNIGVSTTKANVEQPSPALLTVTHVAVSPAQVLPGEAVKVTWTVENTGGTTVNVSLDHAIVLSKNDVFEGTTVDRGLCYHVAPWRGRYKPGGQYTVSHTVKIPANVVVGTYFLIPWPDPPQWTGLDKYVQGAPITIVVPDPPDLHVASIDPPDTGASGQKISLSWVTENIGVGRTRTSSWLDTVFLSSDQTLDESDQALGHVTHYGELGVGQTYQATAPSLPLPPAIEGSYYILVHTDQDNQVYETDDTNNVTPSTDRIDIRIIASDLQVASATATGPGIAGQPVTVHWTIGNAGPETTAISAWNDKIYLSQDDILNVATDTLLGAVSHSGALGPGASYSQSHTVRLPQRIEGPYHLIVAADGDHDLYEHEAEDNNTYATPITMSDPAADLAVDDFTASSSGIAKQPIQVDWSVRNAGTAAAAPPWKDRIYLSKDHTLDTAADILLATFEHTASLAVGASYGPQATPQEVLLPALPDHTEGTYYLFFVADAENRLYEKGHKANNVSAPWSITLTELTPDLQVQTASGPLAGIAGETITVDWTVINHGDAAAAGWKDAIYLSADTTFNAGQDFLCGMFPQTQTIGPGQTLGPPAQPAEIRLPGQIAGTYHLFVVTDAEKSVYEKGAEENNTYRIPQPIEITCRAADLQVSAVNAPRTAKGGATVTISWTVVNLGETATQATSWKDGVYLSADDTLVPASDVQLGLIAHTGSLAPGGSYTESKIFSLPQNLVGAYRVYVVTDSLNQVYEHERERNNLTASPGSLQITAMQVDLQVTGVTAPSTSDAGKAIEVTWSVTNAGTDATVPTAWDDTVYLSPKQTLDPQAIALSTFKHQGSLGPGASYSETKTVTLPKNKEGDFYIIVATDAGTPVRYLSTAKRITTPPLPPSRSPWHLLRISRSRGSPSLRPPGPASGLSLNGQCRTMGVCPQLPLENVGPTRSTCHGTPIWTKTMTSRLAMSSTRVILSLAKTIPAA